MRGVAGWRVLVCTGACFVTLARCADEHVQGDAPIVPELSPVTAAAAEHLGAYVRRLRCSGQGQPETPVAWSAVNVSCQDRVMALELAIAATEGEPTGDPPSLVDTDLTLARLEELASHPGFDVATINVAGPLVTFQTLVDPAGEPIGQEPLWFFWAYHHAVVLNVDGELRVLDLSVGDAPMAIADWIAGFVDPLVTCQHASDDRHAEVWGYWNASFNNFEPPPPPPVQCAYTITPIFTTRRDQTLAGMLEFISGTPSTMSVQFGSFGATLSQVYGVSLADEAVPFVTSAYRAGTVDDVCTRNRMRFCDDL